MKGSWARAQFLAWANHGKEEILWVIWEQLVSAKYNEIVINGVIFFHNNLIFVSSILYLIKGQPKVFTLEDDGEDDDGNMDEDDIIPPFSPDISESSDSDVIQRGKKRHTQPPASATVAVPGKAHVRGKNGITWTTSPVSSKWSWKMSINKSVERAVIYIYVLK